MAIPSPAELGNQSVAVAIDRDKGSQWAVKWAVEHLLKGKITKIVLVHVKVFDIQNQAGNVSKDGRAPSEGELQQLFLPFRGFCARKGIDTDEVVLQDSDISSALVNYIEMNNVDIIVVGASTRNALTRRFKHIDVPTSLAKLAPYFCTVYAISKGKVQSVRASSAANNTPRTPGTSRPYFTNNSTRTTSSVTTYTSSTSSGSGNTCSSVPESPSAQDNTSNNATNLIHYYNARLKTLLGQPPAHPQSSNHDDNPRDSFSRESETSDEKNHYPWDIEGAPTQSRFTPSPSPSPRFTPSPETRSGPRHNLPGVRSMLSDGSSYNSSYTNGSYESSEYSRDQSSYASTSSHSSCYTTENELDEEIRILKQETQKTMGLYQIISDQAAIAKHQAKSILNQEARTIEDFKLSRQAELLIADLERLRTKTAMDAANMTQRLAELEAEKRIIAENAVSNTDGQKKGASDINMTHQIYSLEEIEIATNYFATSQQIGEGGYGPVYRGMLKNTPVAIKVLRPDVTEGLQQYEKEIEVLGRIRHPNMVLLLGACPEFGCLVYEYMENGSLEDRLFCKNNTPPIPWRARFKIAAEITTALLFLHQAKPNPMVHRDLKPANILLDSNYTSKIADVGLTRLVPPSVANEMTQYHMTAAAGTFCYIDPEYQQTGLLGTKSDVYSLGVLLLQLITAKPAMALAYNVEEAIETGEFPKMLDPAIPDWPVEQALSLAQLALKCCELRKKDRPDLASIVLPTLSSLRDFAMCS
ncbi:U-box domain-containing protein 35-like [Silene latifolia]|uniref:U-box domain-containing protein 35-like n=1 Tax=Silene latifolia TaxID=37657 RepID=UPI003D77BBCD